MRRDEQEIAKYIGRRIREIRESLGETQEQFAERLGCEQEQISKIEGAKRRLTASAAYELAVALQIPITSLFPPQADADVLHDERELLEAWRTRDYPQLLQLLTELMKADVKLAKRSKRR